jgi:hypothetical protein
MLIQRKLLVVLLAAILLSILLSIGAIASVRSIQGNIRSFIVNISHSVPVEINAPVELDSGETITVTAPITVNLELRLSVDGQGEATVIEDAVQEPAIEVAEVTAANPDEQRVDDLGIFYFFETDSDNWQLTEWTTYIDSSGAFSIAGEVTVELDAEPMQDMMAVVRFYKAGGALVEVVDIPDLSSGLELNGYSRFSTKVSIEPELIDYYTVSFRTIY